MKRLSMRKGLQDNKKEKRSDRPIRICKILVLQETTNRVLV